MSKTSGTLTTKELRARVELANLQFEEDKPIDLHAVKMYVDLRRREELVKSLSDRIDRKEVYSVESLLEDTREYNKLLAVDYYIVCRDLIEKVGKKMGYGYDISGGRRFIIQMIIQAALPTTPPQETWDLIEILEKKLERSRESTEHLLNQVRQTLEKGKDYYC